MDSITKTTTRAKGSRKPEKTGEDDPWLACKASSHIPNAQTQKALLDDDLMPLPEGGLAELWAEA